MAQQEIGDPSLIVLLRPSLPPRPPLRLEERLDVEMLAIPVRAPAVKWQVVQEEAILVNADSGLYFSLNAVGLFIWESADGEQTLGEILQGLIQEFDIGEDTAWHDMQAFIDEMLREDLISLDLSRSAPAS